MTGIGFTPNDYLAIAKILDKNNNNKIDKNEAEFSNNSNKKIGNGNNIIGTKELANSLEKGDILLKNISPETANKIADYFSKKNENINKKPINWSSDNWISKEDLQISDDLRKKIDTNKDGKISKKEFATALSNKNIVIGKTDYRGIGNTFIEEPKIIDIDKKLDEIKNLNNDIDKAEVLNTIINNVDTYLNSSQEKKLIYSTVNNISSETIKTDTLKNIINNKLIFDKSSLYMSDIISSLSNPNKLQLIEEMSWKRLNTEAQISIIDSIVSLNDEDLKVKTLLNLINNQNIDDSTKEYILNKIDSNFNSHYNKSIIYNKLI